MHVPGPSRANVCVRGPHALLAQLRAPGQWGVADQHRPAFSTRVRVASEYLTVRAQFVRLFRQCVKIGPADKVTISYHPVTAADSRTLQFVRGPTLR